MIRDAARSIFGDDVRIIPFGSASTTPQLAAMLISCP